jgi:glyoxylase-like metal-dependent hydrolase (beta-lactamase superfamily II)
MLERILVGPMYTNCYIISNGKKECIIIDPGGNSDEIVSRASMLKMIPVAIILTHGHFDHTAACGALKKIYREKEIDLQIAIHSNDKNYLGKSGIKKNMETLVDLGLDPEENNDNLFADLPQPTILLEAEDVIFDTGLVVIETPGHTRGSICLYSERDKLLFSGDTLFFQGIGRADLPGGDETMLMQSIHDKIMTLPPETRVFPGHGVPTSIEREQKGNPFLR